MLAKTTSIELMFVLNLAGQVHVSECSLRLLFVKVKVRVSVYSTATPFTPQLGLWCYVTHLGCSRRRHVRYSHQELRGGGGSWRVTDPGVQPEWYHRCSDGGGETQTFLVLAEAQIHPHRFWPQWYIGRRRTYKARYTLNTLPYREHTHLKR